MTLPINMTLMTVDDFIKEKNAKQITSMMIKEPSTDEFHHAGLFSEDIFGQIGSTDRLRNFGYIDLRTRIFHPTIYGNLLRLKALYGEIMSGKTYARYDRETGDMVPASQDEDGAGTGFKFFIDNFPKIKFKRNNSITRNDKVALIEKYRKSCIIDKCIVMPAGLRDITLEDGKPSSDSINKLYTSLLNYAHAMPSVDFDTDIYDSVRFSIQKKVNELYEFIFDMIEGKYGFFQRKYSSRNLALGTRNVISPAEMAGRSPDDPSYLKCDEVKLPLFEASKMFQPLVVYQIKTLFFNDVFSQYSDQVSVIDPKTLRLGYQAITEDEKNKFLTSEGVEKILSLFRDKEFRFNYVTVKNEDGLDYYLALVYDTGDEVTIFKSLAEFKQKLERNHEIFHSEYVRPLTYVELIYIAVYHATLNKCATVTRYPAIEIGSDVPCRVHLMSTNPSRIVKMNGENNIQYMFPEYPIMNTTFIDSAVLHPSILKGLGADFDGNCVTGDSIVKLKYTAEWIDFVKNADLQTYSYILDHTIYTKDNFSYVKIRIDHFPAIGDYKLDKNNAKVYSVHEGCFVSSYDVKSGKESYEPISAFTVDENCDAVSVKLRSNVFGVSPNESMAVFDYETGGIKRVTPKEAYDKRLTIPVIKKDTIDYGTHDTFEDSMYSETCYRDQRDIIPLSYSESTMLRDLAKTLNIRIWLDNNYCMRSILQKIVKYIPDAFLSLKNRILNDNVHWEQIRTIVPLDKQTVYDFLVDTTKVFEINNGVIVYDTVCVNGILSNEANAEVLKYLNSKERYIHPNGSLFPKMTDLIELTLYNLSR